MNLTSKPKFDLPLTIVAFCDVRLDGMSTTLYGVALAWKNGRFVAMPPKLPGVRPGDANALQWNFSGPFPRLICDAMVDRYVAFGGLIPEGGEDTVAAVIGRHTARQQEREARIAEKYDVVEAGGIEWIGLPKPSAESEICDRAGL